MKKIFLMFALLAAWAVMAGGQEKQLWRKGAIHTHSLWSDGRSLPEVAVQTYKNLGYDFMCLSDHNIFQEDDNVWLHVTSPLGAWPGNLTPKEYKYAQNFVPGKLTVKQVGARTFVKLRTYKELCRMFNEEDKFVMVPGEEITTGVTQYQTHFNVFNVEENLNFSKGSKCKTTDEVLKKNYAVYKKAAARAPGKSFFMVNHPFWHAWDIAPRLLIDNHEITHFEICNNTSVEPVAYALSTEKFWDLVLAHRLANGHKVIYATATDDTHYYWPDSKGGTTPDNAWVMVNVPGKLTPDNIGSALALGDFYSSCGVTLNTLKFDGKTLTVAAKPGKGVKYHIEFIVTKKNFDRSITLKKYEFKKSKYTRELPVVSDSIGVTALKVDGPAGEYTLKDDDLYVRAVVVSDQKTRLGNADKMFPVTQRAWTQTFTPSGK